MSNANPTVAAWRERGAIGLKIPACSRCGTETSQTWEEMGAHDHEDVIAVADRALDCGSCGLSSQESSLTGLRA